MDIMELEVGERHSEEMTFGIKPYGVAPPPPPPPIPLWVWALLLGVPIIGAVIYLATRK